MEASVVINNVEFATWAKEDGITVTPILRREKTITTMDGTEYRSNIKKYQIDMEFVDMNEDTLQTLLAALATNPGYVIENMVTPGTSRYGYYYIDDTSFSAHKVVAGTTDFTGLSLTLVEK